jgi:hypothetical protein
MESHDIKLNSAVRRVVITGRQADGSVAPEAVIVPERGSRRKTSRALSLPEQLLRRQMKATQVFASTYLAKHDRSARKRRNGWAKDLLSNVTDAAQKGRKAASKKPLQFRFDVPSVKL